MKSGRTFRLPAFRLLFAIAVATSLPAGSCQRNGRGGALQASGTVEATDAQLGFQVTGRIVAIGPHEGEVVHSGDALAVLDTTETAARRQQAVAAAAAAAAQLAELERGSRSEEISQARAARDAAENRLSDAQRDFDRTQRLNLDGAVSSEALDKARLSLDVAKSLFTQADEQLRLVREGPRAERIAAARAQLAQANAAVAQIAATLANMTLRSPFAGVVTVRSREPGETVPAGASVLTVMNRDDRWVRVYIPETRIGAVRLGGGATITTDTFRGKLYPGTIAFIASEAEFTPKTVQTKEERVKLVYAVKVRIDGDKDYDLKPGMPADVRLETTKP